MKHSTFFSVSICLLLTAGCSSNDSTDKADRINDERIDKQAIAVSDDAKKDAKEVSRLMVRLSDSGLTEYELSKIALQKATNPEVRAYSQRAINDHQQDDRTLRALAKQMNVTLPAELSEKSKSYQEKLTSQKAGTEFDLQYLSNMVDLNDKAIDAADDLIDLAPNDDAKTFARKMLDDDKKHKDQAKQLKNALD